MSRYHSSWFRMATNKARRQQEHGTLSGRQVRRAPPGRSGPRLPALIPQHGPCLRSACHSADYSAMVASTQSSFLKTLTTIRTRSLQAFWRKELGTSEGRGRWGECLLEGISDGSGGSIASGCRQMPTPDQCIKILRSTHDLPWWGVPADRDPHQTRPPHPLLC